jgi:L-fuconolactonase
MPLGETEFVNGVAAMSATGNYGPVKVCAGIIPHVNLQLGAAARELLEAHLRVAGDRIRGVRNSVNWHPDPSIRPTSFRPPKKPCPPGILLDARFREGVAMLAQLGLSYDCWLYHTQLDELAALAGALPQATIITNHIGGAMGVGPYEGKFKEVFADWKTKVRNLARHPNVYMKVGGLGMRVFGLRMGFGDRENPPSSIELSKIWRPYIETCIEAFGPKRCMFESNFPVDKGTCSYAVVWNTFKRLASGASAEEKKELFSGTATRAYCLSV